MSKRDTKVKLDMLFEAFSEKSWDELIEIAESETSTIEELEAAWEVMQVQVQLLRDEVESMMDVMNDLHERVEKLRDHAEEELEGEA